MDLAQTCVCVDIYLSLYKYKLNNFLWAQEIDCTSQLEQAILYDSHVLRDLCETKTFAHIDLEISAKTIQPLSVP